jgi:hypothetical protein
MSNKFTNPATALFEKVEKMQNRAFVDGIQFALAVLTHPANGDFDQATKNLIVAELKKHTDIKLFKESE